jgi:hypothetical protein
LKLVRCNGRELEVRDVGPVIFRLPARGTPIKLARLAAPSMTTLPAS